MFRKAIDLAFNVGHALEMSPPDYVRSILGDPGSWDTRTCRPTELRLAEIKEWSKGLPALAHILIPGLAWKPRNLNVPFLDLFLRPSVVFRYPARATVPNPTPEEAWFFINGICTDHNVVVINARYLHALFGRPLTVLHNFTRGIVPDLAACAVGKEWNQITESAAVAFPPIYAALKNECCKRVILLAHSQGTILSAVVLALLRKLYPPIHTQLATCLVVGPERAVARKLARRWHFEKTMEPLSATDEQADALATFPWPGHGRRQPEPVSLKELEKLEIYCFANCATEMRQLKIPGAVGAPWIESYGNEMDIVARLGVLANVSGPGHAHIDGDRYRRDAAWGHLLNAHYLFPMMTALGGGDPAGGLVPLNGRKSAIPRLFRYLDSKSPAALHSSASTSRLLKNASSAALSSSNESTRRPNANRAKMRRDKFLSLG